MKKTYVKPRIVIETFGLSTSIAGDCETKTNTPNSGKCAYTYEDEFFGEINLFIEGVDACKIKEQDGYNGICYHVPLDTTTLFNS